MDIKNIVESITEAGVRLKIENEKLLVKIPSSASASVRLEIIENKEDIKRYLLSLTANKDTDVLIEADTNVGDLVPLSFSQQALWMSNKLSGGGAEYNIPIRYNVAGAFKVKTAETAFIHILNRHMILRTVYVEENGKAMQKIKESIDFHIDYHDVSLLPDFEKQKSIEAVLKKDSSAPFDLRNDLMLRVAFILVEQPTENQKQRGILIFNMHHIATDGWSMDLLVSEFIQAYQSLGENKVVTLPSLPIQYADFARWQRQKTSIDSLEQQKHYWSAQLADLPACHSIPLDFRRPVRKQHVGARVHSQLSEVLGHKLSNVANRMNVTPFMLFHAALSLVFSRQSDCADIVIGTPIANRTLAQTKLLIGCFINVVALRVRTDFGSLGDYLDHVRSVHLDAQANQDVPFEHIVELLDLQRNSAHTPIIQIILDTNNHYRHRESESDQPAKHDLDISLLTKDQYSVKFDLDLDVGINEHGVYTNWVYDSSIFGHLHIQNLNDQLCLLLKNLADLDVSRGLKLEEIESINQRDKDCLAIDYNQTEVGVKDNDLINTAFERQVLLTPNAMAVSLSDESLSYNELNERANKFARYLIDQFEPVSDALVSICLPPGIDALVSILAVLKTGAAYIPLDCTAPAKRLMQIVDDSNTILVVTSPELNSKFSKDCAAPLFLDFALTKDYSPQNPDVIEQPDQNRSLAYVIYTSGSSGRPKGVMVEHRSVMNYLNHVASAWLQHDVYGSVVSTSLSFDATVTTLLSPLIVGKHVEFLPDSGPLLAHLQQRLFESTQALLFKVTPAHLQALSASDTRLTCEHAHRVIVGGENLTSRVLEPWVKLRLPKALFVNEYGPTEATVGCNSFAADSNFDFERRGFIDIGHAIQNTRLYVLDKDQRQVPFGAVGELCISGVGLARGYLGRSGLTKKSFIDNPFFRTSDDHIYRRMYRTGDLVRYVGPRNLGYIGRSDDQVKIRGFRIELGDIEQQFVQLDNIDSAVVLTRFDEFDAKQLAAFVKVSPSVEEAPSKISLIKQLSTTLPGYMLPDSIMVVPEWPLTANGKVDKNKLLDFREKIEILEQDLPQTETEKTVARIWQKLLHKESDSIGRRSDFLDVGGNSMMIFTMLIEINSILGVKLSIDHVYENLSIQSIATYVDKLQHLEEKREELSTQEVQEEGWL